MPLLAQILGEEGVQWLSDRVLNSRPRGYRFESHWRIEQDIYNHYLVLVQPRKIRPDITEKLWSGM